MLFSVTDNENNIILYQWYGFQFNWKHKNYYPLLIFVNFDVPILAIIVYYTTSTYETVGVIWLRP